MKIAKKVLIPVVGLVLFAGISFAAYRYLPRQSNMTAIKADVAVAKAVEFVNKNMLSGGITATQKDIKDENGLYTFKLSIQEKDYDAYVTKDGKLFFAQGIPQAIPLDKPIGEETKTPEVAKTDKPNLKVFIMSYCPYGLQAQKMLLPVYELFKGKADISVNFVNYAMHGKNEVDENLRQYCIQKEQPEKYLAYAKCFANGTAAADGSGPYAKCLSSAGVNQSKLSVCVSATDKQFAVTANFNDKSKWLSGNYPKFEVENDLNEKYNVQGSPTIILNDVDVSSSLATRSPEALKKVLCSAFTAEPEECKKELSSDQPVAGLGAGTSESGSTGSCN